MTKRVCKKRGLVLGDDNVRQPSASPEVVQAHLNECDECRLEARVIEHIQLDDSSSPAPHLDDLARRRWLDDVLKRIDSDELTPSENRQLSDGESWFKDRRKFIAWAAAAAFVVFMGGWAFGLISVTTDRTLKKESTTPIDPIGLSGQILLSSGDVSFHNEAGAKASILETGHRIEVGKGRVVAALSKFVTIIAETDTIIHVSQLDSNSTAIKLFSGRILGKVIQNENSTPFYVHTDLGRVVIVGTTFSIAKDELGCQVEVFSGKVEVQEKDGQIRNVGVGQGTRLGRERVFTLQQDRIASANSAIELTRLLDSTKGVLLEINSSPINADVVIDEVLLGTSPLIAMIRPGFRTLELRMDDHESVVEVLDLTNGAGYSRTFVLPKSETEGPLQKARPAKMTAPSPKALFKQAQAYRKVRGWSRAADTYKELNRRYPNEPEALSSLVSLGLIQLEHLNRPKAALKSYNTYLSRSPTGSLAQEAAFGRIMALKTLGRKSQFHKALEEFLKDFPGAIQTSRVQRLIDESKP